MKLSYIHWFTTKQSHFVPSCLWSCLTTIEVLNSLTLSYRVCEVVWQLWGTKQSHFVPSCLWSCLTTIEVLNIIIVPSCLWRYLTTLEVPNSLTLSIVFVKLSDNPWGTKQSHIVPSCLWSYLTTLQVLNRLILSHRVCNVLRQPLRY